MNPTTSEALVLPDEPTAAAGYVQEPEIAAQIGRLSRLPSAKLVPALCTNESDDLAREETLTYFLRCFHREGDAASVSEIMRVIVRRVSGRLSRMLAVWRLSSPRDLAEDVIDEVLTDLYAQLLDMSSASRFWEIRFWVCFNRRSLNIVRRRRLELDQIVADDDDGDTIENLAATSRGLVGTPPETSALLKDALSCLPQAVRTAFLLKHYAGYTEDTSADGGQTIASIMGVTGRTVRNYLMRAELTLASWRSGETGGGENDV